MNLRSPILRRTAGFLLAIAAIAVVSYPVRSADKRLVLIAGRPSHPPGMHEFRAGCLLLQKALSSVPGVSVQVYDGGWPSKEVDGARVDDSAALDNADAVLIFSDGGRGNPAIQGERAKVLDALVAKGRRHRLRTLRGRSPGRYSRRNDAAMDWRVLRDELLGQPDVEAGVQQVPNAPHYAWRRSVRHSRRVVLQHAVDGRRGREGKITPSSSRRRATKSGRVPTSARAGRTTTSSPRADRPKR